MSPIVAADEDGIARAVAALAAGQVIGLPTDTVYGVAADPRSAPACAAVFAVKQRPDGVELPVLVEGLDVAADLGDLGPAARALAGWFWPGPLTLVVPRRSGVELHLGGNPTTVGLRAPDHPVARAVCRRSGPVATTSANLHGRPPASTAAEVAALDGVAVVLDAGPCPATPSTVVALTGPDPVLLREGGVPWAEIRAVLER